MEMTVLGKDGKSATPIMGCYGIGVGRALASLIQESNDEKVMEVTDRIYNNLKKAGYEPLLDDRNNSAGFKFADADLLGMPIRVVISPKGLAAGEIEIVRRSTRECVKVNADNAETEILNLINELYKELDVE